MILFEVLEKVRASGSLKEAIRAIALKGFRCTSEDYLKDVEGKTEMFVQTANSGKP